MLVVIPATLCAVVATTVGLARSEPGDVVPAFITLAGVAVVMAVDFVALVNLRVAVKPRLPAESPSRSPKARKGRVGAAKAPSPRSGHTRPVESRPAAVSTTRRASVPVPVKPDALALGAQDDYVDSLLSDLAR